MKLFVYENSINREKISYFIMSTSREYAAKQIAEKLQKALGDEFSFEKHIAFCIEGRERLVKNLGKDVVEIYQSPLEKWKTFTKLSDLVAYEMDEHEEGEVVEQFGN